MDDPVPPMGLARIDCSGEVLDEPKMPCTIVVEDHEGAVVYEGWSGVERRGRSSQSFPKGNFGLELWHDGAELVPAGSSWRYLHGASAAPVDWAQPGFDDSGWDLGAAPLGYGDEGLATELEGTRGEGSLTSWFRVSFTVDDPLAWQGFALALQRDDGAAVYLNGVEVLRDNLPSGTLSADTAAITPLDAANERLWVPLELEPEQLAAGENVLAIEIHQAGPDSSDQWLDLRLAAQGFDRGADLFGMGVEEDWVLNGNWADRALYRNKLAYDLFRSFGGEDRYAAESVFVELVLDGDPVGIYTLGERVEVDRARLPLEGDAFVVKSDDRDEPIVANRVGYGDWVVVDPHEDELDDARVYDITHTLEGWQDAVVGWDYDPDDGIFAWLDMDAAIDFVLIQELAKNTDAYTLSVHLWRDDTGLLHLTPWDLDLAFGYPVDDCGAEGWARRQEWVYAMADHPAFVPALADRWDQLRAGPLDDAVVADWLDRYGAVLEPAVDANFERWPMDEIAFWDDQGEDRLCPVGSWEDEHARMGAWLLERMAWMDDNVQAFEVY